MASKDTQMTIRLRAYRHTAQGRLIEWLNQHPRGTQAIAIETLEARFLPLVMDPDDDQARALALECALLLKGYLEHIQLRWDLPELAPISTDATALQDAARATAQGEAAEERYVHQETLARDQQADDIFA